jgi:hypothetical protein
MVAASQVIGTHGALTPNPFLKRLGLDVERALARV